MTMMKQFIITTALGGVMALGATASLAANFDIPAQVTVIDALKVDPVTELNFGQVVKPAAGTESITISPSGAVSGTAVRVPNSLPARSAGQYTISGGNAKVSINVANLSGGVKGITLKDVTYNYNGTTGTFSGLPLAGQDTGGTIYLGATLDIESTVEPDEYAPGFVLVVDYE